MQEREHHVQDAMELLAPARLQKMAEDAGRACTYDSADKFAAFEAYAAERGLTESDFSSGPYRAYRESLDTHLPTFYERLAKHYGNECFDFIYVDPDYRNASKKGDFEIRPERSPLLSVSLKNYRGSADRPQFNTQTFNTFALGFLFPKRPGDGVGTYYDFVAKKPFYSGNKKKRDAALINCGYEAEIDTFEKLDKLQADIRKIFVNTLEWEYYDEARADPIRKAVGLAGVEIMAEMVARLPKRQVKNRLLKMAGMDGAEALLIMDPRVMAESITEFSPLKKLYEAVQADDCEVQVEVKGQTLALSLVVDDNPLVIVEHPHTLNLNGSWILDEEYRGGKLHPKEKMVLQYGQRRPKKHRQISVFVLTYINLRAAGIFVEEGPEA